MRPIQSSSVLGAAMWLAATAVGAQGGDTQARLTLMVANRSSHEVTFVDLTAGKIVDRVPTGAGPHLLSNVSDGLVVATGYGEFPEPHDRPVDKRPPFTTQLNSRLTAIDIDTRTVVNDFVIDGCLRPHASWIVDTHVYVTCENERQIARIALATGEVVQRLETQQDGTHVLSFDTRTQTLAASNTGSGSVTLFRLHTDDSMIVPLYAGSEGALAIAGRFWIANGGDGSVSILDAESGTVDKSLENVCSFPIAFSAASDGNVWLACFASSELIEFDPNTQAILRRIDLGAQPLNILAHPTRQVAYVSYPRKNAIGEIDLDREVELRRITVGIEPDGLRWALPTP